MACPVPWMSYKTGKKQRIKYEKKTIALRPYLGAVKDICRPLSKEQLVELVLKLAQDKSSSGRLGFLDRIEARSPGAERIIKAIPDVNQLLDDIQALKADIVERIEAIKNGDYEALDDWDWEDTHYDDEPGLISDEQSNDMADLFTEAGALFQTGIPAGPELYTMPCSDSWRNWKGPNFICPTLILTGGRSGRGMPAVYMMIPMGSKELRPLQAP